MQNNTGTCFYNQNNLLQRHLLLLYFKELIK